MYNFVFIADAGFYLPTVVAVNSLVDAISNSRATIYCIQCGMTDMQCEKITQLKNENIDIVMIDINSFYDRKEINISQQYCAANKTALVKFDLAEILRSLDKVLYLDGDIIVKKNIIELFREDISEVYAAVVADSGIIYNKTIKNNFGGRYYFNSGVMLLNLDKIRKDNIREKLYFEKVHSTDKSLMDQNVFNNIFGKKVRQLPLKFNCQYVNLERARYWHDLKLEDVNALYNTNYKSWSEIENDAYIIHYASFDKPWKYSDVTSVKLWNIYCKKCGIDIEKLKRKKLHVDILYQISKYKFMKYPVNFIWECETAGIKKAILDVKKIFRLGYNIK